MADKCEIQIDDHVQEAVAGRLKAAPGQRHARHLECSICKNPAFDTPVRTNPCGHMYHQECLERWLRGKLGNAHSCPDCRKRLPPGRSAFTPVDRVAKAILDDIDVECPQDCEAPAPKRVRFDELGNHIRNVCPQTKLICSGEGCDVVLPRQQMTQTHLQKCEHVLVTCKQCKTGVKRGIHQVHKTDHCSHRRITCEYCKQGSIVFHKKEDHEMQCTGTVPVKQVAALRKANRELLERNVALQERLEVLEEREAARVEPQILDVALDPDRIISSYNGLMFDVKCKDHPITVMALWIAHECDKCDWEIWARVAPGGYRELPGPAGWEKLKSGIFDGQEGTMHRCTFSRPIGMAPGSKQAFYVCSSSKFGVQNSHMKHVATEDDMIISMPLGLVSHSRTRFEMESGSIAERAFVGRIEYLPAQL
eukprot:TRINITY_DN9604_c0_g3_i1.p1 TRINITY_DN9604_c0_g3~~TRINITY_DN9604_c0_g3_i1.p1  ORF type:complete len:455 (+),score=173.91 TRINITY_DN9604_c0_g3_i1:102-1367(+)